MKIVLGIVGAILGALVGGAVVLLLMVLTAGGNDVAGGFFLMFAGPLGLPVGAIVGAVAALRALRTLRNGERTRQQKAFLAAAGIVGPLALTVGLLWAGMMLSGPPSDQKMLRNFARHRSTFDTLAQMTQADKRLQRVDQGWTIPGNPATVGVSPARLATYHRLLTGAGVPRGFQTTDDGMETDFYYWLTGSAITSDTDKGYAYLTKPPPNLLDSLDQCRPDERHVVTAYRHITGNWYLFYEYLPG